MRNMADQQYKAAFYHTQISNINNTYLLHQIYYQYIFGNSKKDFENIEVDYGLI